jgi:hypothetical protein
MQLYERVLANPDAKVINIRNDGRFQAYGIGSDEYRELMCGLPITLDTSGDEIVSKCMIDIRNRSGFYDKLSIQDPCNWAVRGH